jgi:dTDP-4-dehydrorhamnose 3,5-epimerase
MKPQILSQPVFTDHRGKFVPIKLSEKWVQSNISINTDIFVFRGLHYQKNPKSQTKLVSVVQGKIVDFIVNIDKNSSDFGKVDVFVLKEGNSVLVPNNCAHGFLTLERDTIINYLVDNEYSQKDEGCIDWYSVNEVKEIVTKYMTGFIFKMKISDKDTQGITLEEFKNGESFVG